MAKRKDWHFDKEEQRRLKRDKLLKVAAACFNQKGFSGTSLKDVAHKLNISDAAIYYYVKNKEELVNLCYIRARLTACPNARAPSAARLQKEDGGTRQRKGGRVRTSLDLNRNRQPLRHGAF